MDENIFGPVISRYTDGQAVDDGILVDIASWALTFRDKPVNRITRTVWSEIEPFLIGETAKQQMTSFKHMLQTKLAMSGENGGDIVKVPPHYWLLENELAGWTLMLPSDY